MSESVAQHQLNLVLTAVNAVRAIPSFRSTQPSSVANAIALLVSVDGQGYTPLQHAAASGDAALLGKVLAVLTHVRAPFPTVDARGKHGRTALHWAVIRGNSAVIKALLDAGASASAEDEEGKSVLRFAIEACSQATEDRKSFYHDMVRFLLQCGADATSVDQHGAGVVHAAAAAGDADLLGILVELGGAPANGLDDEGESALFYAVREQQLALVPRLVQYGCDPTTQNDAGETVLEFSRSLGDPALATAVEHLLQPQRASQTAGKEDKMDLASSAAGLFSSGGAFTPAMWSSNPAHLIIH